MLQIESFLNFKDNTGIYQGKIIHVYKSNNKRDKGVLGDVILISPQKKNPRKIFKQKLFFGLLAGLKKNKKRLNGHYIKFGSSFGLLLMERDSFKATRIKGPISGELRYSKLTNIPLVAPKIV